MQETGSRAGQVLDTQKHVELLCGGGQQQGIGLSLAGFQSDAAVALLTAQQQRVVVDERFVDHHRLDRGCLVHLDVGVGLQVTAGGLFDVLDPVPGRGRSLADLRQEFEHILDVFTFLVEVGRVPPFRAAPGRLGLGRHRLDGQYTGDIPVEIVTVELDLQVGQAIGGDPLGQRLGQSIGDARFDVGIGQRVESSDEVIQRQRGLGLAEGVGVEVFVGELLVEVLGEVVGHEVGREGIEGIDIVDTPKRIVDGGVRGAGGDQLSQLGDRLVEPLLLCDGTAEVMVFGRESKHDVQRVTVLGVAFHQRHDPLGKFAHRRLGGIG